MNIALVPAQQVPQIFSMRIKSRRDNSPALITSMSAQFQDNPITQSLIEHSLPDDAFVLDYFGHWHGIIPTRIMKRTHEEARDAFQKKFRGLYTVVGPPPRINFTNSTILNRSHIKAYIVGNKVLSLGGVNCVPASYYNFIDIMLDFESEAFVSRLRELLAKGVDIRQRGIGESFWLSPHNKVIIDYGRRNNRFGLGNKSIILDNLMCDLEKELTSVTLSSTSVPSGRLDAVLSNHSLMGRNITFYTNHPSKFRPPYHSSYEKLLQQTCALKAKTAWIDNRPDRFNHLKAAIISYPAGRKVAYMGSHNFNALHVWAGTADICLRTTDKRLISQLEAFIAKNLAK